MTTTDISASQLLLESSPVNRLVFATLITLGLIVLIARRKAVIPLLKASWPIALFFSYCLVSVLWSDFAGVALKRWIKAIGDLVMLLIIVTEAQPAAALKRIFTRTGFVLLPASVLLIKYYGDLGRFYDPWEGQASNTGVTTNKNVLGVVTFTLSLGATWLLLSLLRDKSQPNRFRHFLAQGTLLAFGISLLVMAHSATSGSCFVLGAGLMLACGLPVLGRRPATVHVLVLLLLIAGGFAILIGSDVVVHALGRQTNLTGRTDIWQILIPMAPNPLVGAGFESFWLGPRLEKVWSTYEGLHLNEAHNGYLEMYLNLGYVGVALLALILIYGYRRAVSVFRVDPTFGSLLVAYILTAAIYSITEAGFRQLDLIWVFLLYAILAANQLIISRGDLQSQAAKQLPPHQSSCPC
jgi:O-antigen ligase